jgi:hypothetical protein
MPESETPVPSPLRPGQAVTSPRSEEEEPVIETDPSRLRLNLVMQSLLARISNLEDTLSGEPRLREVPVPLQLTGEINHDALVIFDALASVKENFLVEGQGWNATLRIFKRKYWSKVGNRIVVIHQTRED